MSHGGCLHETKLEGVTDLVQGNTMGPQDLHIVSIRQDNQSCNICTSLARPFGASTKARHRYTLGEGLHRGNHPWHEGFRKGRFDSICSEAKFASKMSNDFRNQFYMSFKRVPPIPWGLARLQVEVKEELQDRDRAF